MTMKSELEVRHCFTKKAHEPHVWFVNGVLARAGYQCMGEGIDPETNKVREINELEYARRLLGNYVVRVNGYGIKPTKVVRVNGFGIKPTKVVAIEVASNELCFDGGGRGKPTDYRIATTEDHVATDSWVGKCVVETSAPQHGMWTVTYDDGSIIKFEDGTRRYPRKDFRLSEVTDIPDTQKVDVPVGTAPSETVTVTVKDPYSWLGRTVTHEVMGGSRYLVTGVRNPDGTPRLQFDGYPGWYPAQNYRLLETDSEPQIENGEAPAVLDARAAYGDRVQNMAEQAQLWNAYLSGRPIEAHDVPIMFMLVKAHRAGKMPDYADNYDDMEGYLRIAREVIGDRMIEATTAAEYQEKKSQNQEEGELIDSWRRATVINPRQSGKASSKPHHPYENVERDMDADDQADEHRD